LKAENDFKKLLILYLCQKHVNAAHFISQFVYSFTHSTRFFFLLKLKGNLSLIRLIILNNE